MTVHLFPARPSRLSDRGIETTIALSWWICWPSIQTWTALWAAWDALEAERLRTLHYNINVERIAA